MSDGTAAGTHALIDPMVLPSNGEPTQLTQFGTSLLFIASHPSTGREIYRLDTATDAISVIDLNPTGNGVMDSSQIVVLNGFAVFIGTSATSEGAELWRTDGTAMGTSRVADIYPGSASAFDSNRMKMVKVGDRALFFASGGPQGVQIWSSDGTAPNTVALTSATSGLGQSTVLLGTAGTRAYLSVPVTGQLMRLYVTDGTVAGTRDLVGAAPVVAVSASSLRLDGDDNTAFIHGIFNLPSEPLIGVLYKYEPATHVTTRLANTPAYGDPILMGADGPRIVFSNDDGTTGREPHVSDGTLAGTGSAEEHRASRRRTSTPIRRT